MLFLVLSFSVIAVLSYTQVTTSKNNGMQEYCKMECKGYKY